MLNICAKALWRCQPLKHTYRVLALQNYATFGARDILHETSDEAGTLVARFAKHVALERQKICEQVPTKVRYPDYFPISDLHYFQRELQNTDVEQIANVIIFAFTYRPNAEPNKFAVILNDIDRYAVNNIEKMNLDTILKTLYAFLFLIPNWMTRLDFYYRAMQRLYDDINQTENKSKEIFLQLCFYMGLCKKQTTTNVNKLFNSLLDNHLGHYINEMSTLDLALVSNAAYKSSTILKNNEFNNRLLKEVLEMSDISNGNDALLVTFIKSMRLQRLRSSEVCENIENICKDVEKLQSLQVTGQVHLFAYLAENLWDSKLCIEPLVASITEQVKLRNNRNYVSRDIRGKDISTFLWACAQLSCKISSMQFQNIEARLLQMVDDGQFNNFPDQLVDSCLSLWILGYKSKELFQTTVQRKSEWVANRKQPKVESRLTVLLSAAKIEKPDWITTSAKAFDLKANIPPYLLNNQEKIPYQEIIDELLKEETVSSASLSCPINGINIPGIQVSLSSSEKQIFLEFMTPSQTLHFSKQPVSILKLKVHLLQSLGYKVNLVSATDALNLQNIKDTLNATDVQQEDTTEASKTSIQV